MWPSRGPCSVLRRFACKRKSTARLASLGRMELHDRGIQFIVAKAHLPLRETIATIGGVLAESCRFSHLADAVAAFKGERAANA